MGKRMICMILTAAMLLLLGACGSAPETQPETTAAQTAESVTEAAAETTAAPEPQKPSEAPETTEPETEPMALYTGDLDPEKVYARVQVWDETLNEYAGADVGKRILMREESFDGPNETPDGHYCYAYDTAGNERVYAYYGDDGLLFGWGISEYDENGYLILQTRYDKDGAVREKTAYTNNENGIAVKEEFFEKDEATADDWDEYELDAAGNRVKRYGYRKGQLDFTYEYEYDAEGRLTHTRRYDAEGVLSFHWENVYDADGHKIAENSYDPETDTLRDTAEADWSDDFHTRTNDWYSGGEKKGVDVYTFDDDGNTLLFETYDNSGVLQHKTVYTYYDQQ